MSGNYWSKKIRNCETIYALVDLIIVSILEVMENFLNARVIRSDDMTIDTFLELVQENDMVIYMLKKGVLNVADNSDGFWTESYVWMGQKPHVISPSVTYFLPFKGVLWIIVIVTLIAVTLTWWLILRKTESSRTVTAVYVDVISLVLGVSISNEPRRIALRILVIFYLVYVIHIQTGYTSNLINILVLPKNEDSINNIDQLEKSTMEIYVQRTVYYQYFGDHLESFKGIRNRLIVLKDSGYTHYLSKLNHTNYFAISRRSQVQTPKQYPSVTASYLKGKAPNFFVDDSPGLDHQYCFIMTKGNYFLPSLNRIISYLYESGCHSWLTQKVDYTYIVHPGAPASDSHYGVAPDLDHDFETGLTLTQVSGAFFILALGYIRLK
ncbi:uncharacterized protein LOC116175393 isoform X2 [Photinus pyralis]|uniref:uncharacterized protein LOC116175392 isoform X2 n=1 Tax=Photinus pyralis TaxID=7054 RepID=UPI00126729E8|nr:uncharacterized protein LOC116175392 isoform X2 [Photinus pyralis]XP_031349351.1 uncharacterized protein LOC116175393 isoform X2 [Photinus pyralis]